MFVTFDLWASDFRNDLKCLPEIQIPRPNSATLKQNPVSAYPESDFIYSQVILIYY